MDYKDFNESMEQLDVILKQEGISRRDAMKMLGFGGAAMMMASGVATPAKASSNATGKILIVGGGLAGVATAALLKRELKNPDITVLEPCEKSVSYQPGQTLVAGGVWEQSDIMYETANFMPDGVTWIKEKAVEFDPENNSVKTSGGKEIKYDYMVVAAGLKLDYARLEGLGISETITSLGDNQAVKKVVGKNGITSIYFADGAADTWNQIQELIEKAKSGKKLTAVFTDPDTPIKCGGAPKKIMYLVDARLREAGVRENVELVFYPNGGKMFGVPEYHDAILKQYEERDMKWNYNHNLVAVDPEAKVAIFNKHWLEKGEWDDVLEEYEMVARNERVEVPFDFIHITPPMIAAEEIANSPIGSNKGWVPVKQETLQHVKYPNIFALGDIAAVPMAKTGGSARKQYRVVVENLIAVMEGREVTAQYDGYTVCPLITSIGTVMLAEFNWTGKPTPSFPLDPTKERWIWWLLKAYMLKPMTQYGMLSGRA